MHFVFFDIIWQSGEPPGRKNKICVAATKLLKKIDEIEAVEAIETRRLAVSGDALEQSKLGYHYGKKQRKCKNKIHFSTIITLVFSFFSFFF